MLGRRTLESSYKRIENNSLIDAITDMNYQEIPPIFDALQISQTAVTLSLSNEKIGLIREYSFEEFCELNFRSFTSWGLKIPLTEIMSYSDSIISKSLTKLKDKDSKSARQTFKSKR